ncbi:MAG TPA: 3-phosphoshikimate 1-carboxyvinyltransferase [Syntrophomonadaceae bacterium]|nr:3-phosphoshikimate 1-carboxyvinyltransferase [Syntrophomonadaceae bacterium]
MNKTIKKAARFRGEVKVGADKSISHRALIFSALATGESIINNFLNAEDTWATLNCMRGLGVKIEENQSSLIVKGRGLASLTEAKQVLECGNSGTTMRLLTGLLAGQDFFSVLTGDRFLNQRPMSRLIKPLSQMGAEIQARAGGTHAPLAIKGTKLRGMTYNSPIASAQVKSALILAGLGADDATTVIEPHKSRDHTERLLIAMGANIVENNLAVTVKPSSKLFPQTIEVPNDISSAAFFMVAASIIPGAEILIKNVGINPTRAGIIEVLSAMGVSIKKENEKTLNGELVADLLVVGGNLNSVEIKGEILPRLIDELPVIAVAMAVAQGTSVVKDARELRVKETDRIKAICSELSKMGVNITETEDGFIIEGNYDKLQGAKVDSWGDHRIAMSLAVAGLLASGETIITNAQVVDISFPDFWDKINDLVYY